MFFAVAAEHIATACDFVSLGKSNPRVLEPRTSRY